MRMSSLPATPPPSSPEESRSPTPPSVPAASSTTATVNEDHLCSICSNKFDQPHVLTCLHVFCLPCLEKQLAGNNNNVVGNNEDEEDESAVETIANKVINGVINPNELKCGQCDQVTTLGAKGLAGLVPDYVLSNMLDMSAVEDMQILCTSCKAKEKAVARCSDCANFLCPNCVTAHQYMRCFENHKVVSFEDLQNNEVSIHKPLFCTEHSSETLKFFCHTCQTPICNECMVNEHKQPSHNYERIVDIEEKQREELRTLITESKGKISFCEDAQANLENALTELQLQHDNAKSLITETFHSYRALLEKKKESLLQELDEIHKTQELSVMDLCQSVDQSIQKIEHGCGFTERILANGNEVELLSMKRLITDQLLSLINNTPKPEVKVDITFTCDLAKFEQAVEKNVGSFKKDEEPQAEIQPSPSSLQSSFETEAFALPSGVLSPESHLLPEVTSAEFLPALPDFCKMPSMPLNNMAAAQNAFVAAGNGMSAAPHSHPHHHQSIIGSSMHGLGDCTTSRNSLSPAMSDSGISVDAASSGSGSNTPMINLAALAKLGSVNMNPQQGRMLRSSAPLNLNSTMLPGLSVNSSGTITSSSSAISSRVTTPQPTDAGNAFVNLLGQPSSRSETPSLSDISALLPQGSMQNISSIGGSSSGSNSMLPSPNIPLSGGSGGSPQNFNLGVPPPPFPSRANRMSSMEIRCKFGQLGPGKGQFNSPHGFCLGLEEDIIVADTNNHRIQVFEKSGDFKYQFGIPGREEGQLWYPRKVAVMRHSGKYVVCDRGNERSRMQIFTRNGHFIKKIAIRYIDIVAGLAITQQGHIVAVDSVSPTVFCIAETGDLLKWFDCSDYMREPSDIAISGKEYFVCDFKGHCVVVFNEDGQFLRRIGCENITNFPNGIDISDAGDVLVGDSHGNRFHVAVFQREGSLIGEFECPYVKVSRCCGLKITSEGYVVTLAKNNHHVLVLNTLYIT